MTEETQCKKLDSEFLESIYEGDAEHAIVVFEQFLKNNAGQIEDINNSYLKNDVEAFRQKMHKVKPVFSFVGLTTLTKKAEVIEKKCLEITAVESVNRLYTEFLQELDEYLPLVKNEYKRLSAA